MGLKKFVYLLKKLSPDSILIMDIDLFLLQQLRLLYVEFQYVTSTEGTTEALLDDAFRHSITKMSHVHFAATKSTKKELFN